MSADRKELLSGTLDLIVLKALSLGPMHGWGLAQRIEAMSHETFEISQGSLYPALQRLKRNGWVGSEWQKTENNRRARYYALTAAGAKRLGIEQESWRRSSSAVDLILKWEEEPG